MFLGYKAIQMTCQALFSYRTLPEKNPSKGPLRFDNPVMAEPHAEVKCVCFQGVTLHVLPLVPVCSRCVLHWLRRTVLYERRTEYGHGTFSLCSLSVLSAVGRSPFVQGGAGGRGERARVYSGVPSDHLDYIKNSAFDNIPYFRF